MDLFDVYVLRFDVSEERAARGLVHIFGLTDATARVFIHSVPRIGKRNVPTQLAERYVRALHAAGAVVECRRSGTAPLGEAANRAQLMSLPPPSDLAIGAVSDPPHIMQDSLGIMAPLAYSPDMPEIPKAPRVPADLHHLRARKGPDSLAPNWHPTRRATGTSSGRLRALSSDPAAWSEPGEPGAHSRDPLSELNDTRDELEARGLRSPRRSAGRSPAQQRSADDKQDDEAEAESEPPLSPSPFAAELPGQAEPKPGPWYTSATHQLLLAALILGGMGLALSAGVFQRTDVRHTAALREVGLEAGTFETATSFVARSQNQFDKMSADQLRALTEVLMSSGAREVWVADIQQGESQRTSRTLVVELPDDTAARGAVLQELRNAHNPGVDGRNMADHGQRYVRLDF